MVKKIIGWILFAWMAIAGIGVVYELPSLTGFEFWVNVGILVLCIALAGLGLKLALSKPKRRNY
jgi:hypothetical protein